MATTPELRRVVSDNYIAYDCKALANRLGSTGLSYPLASAENAVGCGMVIIALNANGARCA